jgi:hypothetical protein
VTLGEKKVLALSWTDGVVAWTKEIVVKVRRNE